MLSFLPMTPFTRLMRSHIHPSVWLLSVNTASHITTTDCSHFTSVLADVTQSHPGINAVTSGKMKYIFVIYTSLARIKLCN